MDLSFIILEYDCLQEIAPCLASIREHAAEASCEYIITSNSQYHEEIKKRLIQEYPGVHWLFNERNGGYAYAMNRGIEAAKGEWVALLNADARLKYDISPAMRYLRENPKVGLLGPKIVNANGELQDSARPFMTPGRAIKRILKRAFSGKSVLLEKGIDYNKNRPVDWVIGAFMMVKKEAVDVVGMLDEGFFMYVEDMDWCRRFWGAGFEVHYFPELAVEYAGTRRSSRFMLGKGLPGCHAMIHLRSYLRFLRKYSLARGRHLERRP